nr:ATP-dependent DNA ligase [Pseudomonas sp.]
LITGSMRIGVSRLLVTRALAAVAGIDPKRMAQRLMGYTDRSAEPSAAAFEALLAPVSDTEVEFAAGQPYPFFLAHPLQTDVATFEITLGPVGDWQVEWKWDGIRAQVVQRDARAWIWSRGEELVTDRFPELATMAETLPSGTVLDGEIVVWENGRACPFARLQKRLGRKNVTPAVLREQPVALLAYDVLEWQGVDWRARTQQERRAVLEEIVGLANHPTLQISPLLEETSWTALAECRSQARERGVEGLMLKARNAHYGVGRTRDVGVWWKWKIDPFSVDAVLLYAQPGHGRRASLYTDYTFAVWSGPPDAAQRTLVPFAKAYSGLTDEEIRRVDAIVRKTTLEKFGPVRSLRPTLVFELGFEGISHSPRHKSGVAVRFPRMLRWRHDKPVQEADSLDTLKMLLPS